MKKQKITTSLWFNTQAEEAARFYVSVFGGDSKVLSVERRGDAVMSVSFELDGQRYVGINGNARHQFNDSASLMISCEDQPEVDRFWDALTAGGSPTQCGWLKDKFGVSWQVVPDGLMKFLQERDPVKSGRIMKAFMAMKKIDLPALERARAGS